MASPNSPDEIAREQGLPLMRALIDLDLGDPSQQLIGADPMDLSDIPMEPVKSLITPTSVITIMAHRGEGEAVAELLAARPDMSAMTIHYGEHYQEQGVMDFAFNALTQEQVRNVERNTGRKPGLRRTVENRYGAPQWPRLGPGQDTDPDSMWRYPSSNCQHRMISCISTLVISLYATASSRTEVQQWSPFTAPRVVHRPCISQVKVRGDLHLANLFRDVGSSAPPALKGSRDRE